MRDHVLNAEFAGESSTDLAMRLRYDWGSIIEAFKDTDIQVSIQDDEIVEEEWSQDSQDDESNEEAQRPDSSASRSSGEVSLYSQN